MQLEIIYKDLPQNILFIYTTICDKKYGIINENVNIKERHLYKEACHFLFENNHKNVTIIRGRIYTHEWLQLFDDFINKKATLGKELFSLAEKTLKRKKEEIA